MYQICRYLFFSLSLILLSLSTAIMVKVKYLGLYPWEAMSVGLFQKLGLSVGTWNIITGMTLMSCTLLLNKQYVKLGTFFNVILTGVFLDFILSSNILPDATNTWTDYIYLLIGITLFGMSGGMNVSAGFGAGPRDGFMLAISPRFGWSIARMRIVVESIVVVIAFLLGGPVFFTTLIYTFISSPIYQRSLFFHQAFFQKLKKKEIEVLES
ncbi:YczE/YyaS/YitT family protein [Metabacillus fastidiosus]|uniref:YczE/YyaS/YitT family protein n=1 Tax=Metabacillus fastidiosus TaxID=1458 RepID=UPI003D2C76F6